MKKMILSLMGVTLGYAAFAVNCVSVKQISTDYTNHQITIALTRACTGDATNHRNTVWVFVDYRAATGTTKGAWTRATISATSAGTVINSGSSKGAWIYGANGTQTVTLTLSGMPAKYDWCAIATDYPPNTAAYSSGVHTLKGNAPFVINGNITVAGKTHNGTINTIVDATGCPGWIERDVPTASGTCRPGLTLVSGYCRNLTADEAVKITGCGSTELEVKTVNISAPSPGQWTSSQNCPGGWRPATLAEYDCFNSAANRLLTNMINQFYLTVSYGSGGYQCGGSCPAAGTCLWAYGAALSTYNQNLMRTCSGYTTNNGFAVCLNYAYSGHPQCTGVLYPFVKCVR